MLKGNLTFRGKSKKEGIFELVFGDNILAIPLINDESEIHIDADLSKTKNFYTLSGSPASTELRDLLSAVGEKNNEHSIGIKRIGQPEENRCSG